MRTSTVLLGVLGVLASCGVACSAPADAGDAEGASDEAAVVVPGSTCSATAKDEGFSHYKKAVDHAKLRLAGDFCDDGNMLIELAQELQLSVTACGDFRSVIASSKWAQPVRTALAGTIALAVLDGRVTTAEGPSGAILGLESALAGTTMFGPAPGAQGNLSKIEFGAGGVATVSKRVDAPNGGPWKASAAKYVVRTSKNGATQVEITINGGKSTVYKAAATATPGFQYMIELTPVGGGDRFETLPSECEA